MGLQQTGSQQSCWQGEEVQQEGWQLDCWQYEARQELLQAGWQQGLDSQLTGVQRRVRWGLGHSSWGRSRGIRSSSLDSCPPPSTRRSRCRSHRTQADRPGWCSKVEAAVVVVEGLEEGEDVSVCVSECVKCLGRCFLFPLLVCVLSWGRFYILPPGRC